LSQSPRLNQSLRNPRQHLNLLLNQVIQRLPLREEPGRMQEREEYLLRLLADLAPQMIRHLHHPLV
jgi:hypothetical protein